MSRGRRSVVVVAVTLAFAMLGGPSLAAAGASQTVRFVLADSRGFRVVWPAGASDSGSLVPFGTPSRLTIEAHGGSPSSILEVTAAGAGKKIVRPGTSLALPELSTPPRFGTGPWDPRASVSFTASGP